MMAHRGRLAAFPAAREGKRAPKAPSIAMLRFFVPLRDGGEALVDLRDWPRSHLAATFGALLREAWHPLGALDKTAVAKRVSYVRRFLFFLDRISAAVTRVEAITPDLIDRYEAWLEQSRIGRIYQRHLLASLISLLRLLAEREPGRLLPATVDRLTFLGHGPCGRSRPNDAYSGAIAASLRRAARTQILAAASRVTPADQIPEIAGYDHPVVRARLDTVLQAIDSQGAIATSDCRFSRLQSVCHRRRRIPVGVTDLHAWFHLQIADVIAFIILLSLETGIEIECLNALRADCLKNPSKGSVEIEYCKRRARGSEWKRLRVRDGGSSTPGGIMRLALRLTARARRHLGSERLWCYHAKRGLTVLDAQNLNHSLGAFVARYRLVDDSGRPLRVDLRRLRKTHKAEHYIRTQGQLEQFVVGHTPDIAANHYADIPALRHLHEQTIADGLSDALDAALKPRVITPGQETVMRADPAHADLPVPPQEVITFLDGAQDLWLASCSGFYDSPFGRKGNACPVPFWGCLECANAVITSRKLPALIAFADFVVAQRARLSESDWAAKFARAHDRITRQILPAFPENAVAAARAIAASRTDLLYLPPEAQAQ
jgi:hypothetical protein